MTADRTPSAQKLRELLAASDNPLRMYTTEALYHVQVDYTCQLLDAVDEVTDEVTAGMITDVVYEKLAGDGASEAARRIRDARQALEQSMRTAEPFQPRWYP